MEFCGKGTRSRQAGRPAAALTGARPASLPPGTGSKVVQPFHRPRETKLPYPHGAHPEKGVRAGPPEPERSPQYARAPVSLTVCRFFGTGRLIEDLSQQSQPSVSVLAAWPFR